MRVRNAHRRSAYPKASPDQAAIDEYYKQHGAKQAVNTGKVFSFNNRSKRSVGHANKKQREGRSCETR